MNSGLTLLPNYDGISFPDGPEGDLKYLFHYLIDIGLTPQKSFNAVFDFLSKCDARYYLDNSHSIHCAIDYMSDLCIEDRQQQLKQNFLQIMDIAPPFMYTMGTIMGVLTYITFENTIIRQGINPLSSPALFVHLVSSAVSCILFFKDQQKNLQKFKHK